MNHHHGHNNGSRNSRRRYSQGLNGLNAWNDERTRTNTAPATVTEISPPHHHHHQQPEQPTSPLGVITPKHVSSHETQPTEHDIQNSLRFQVSLNPLPRSSSSDSIQSSFEPPSLAIDGGASGEPVFLILNISKSWIMIVRPDDDKSTRRVIGVSEIAHIRTSRNTSSGRVVIGFFGQMDPYDVCFADGSTRNCFVDMVMTLNPHITVTKLVTKKSANWIPDSQTAKCMRCQSSFNLVTNRRHHCRHCGFVICGSCSSREAVLPQLGYIKPVRVCDHCFTHICAIRASSIGQGAATPLSALHQTDTISIMSPHAQRLRQRSAEAADGTPDVQRDVYGFVVGSPESAAAHREYLMAYAVELEKQREQWNNYIVLHTSLTRTPELKKLVRRGIPPELRGRVWQVLVGAQAKSAAYAHDYYASVLRTVDESPPASAMEIEKDLRRTFPGHSVYETEEGLETLKRVLMAYAIHNPLVGYCQSMNFICALLLLFMEEKEAFWTLVCVLDRYACVQPLPARRFRHISTLSHHKLPRNLQQDFSNDAENADTDTNAVKSSTSSSSSGAGAGDDDIAWPVTTTPSSSSKLRSALSGEPLTSLLTKLLPAAVANAVKNTPKKDPSPSVHAVPPCGYYYHARNLAGVHIDQAVFKELVAMKLPRVYAKLRRLHVPLETLTVHWFLCLMVNTLPLETTLHVWDCLFYEGISVLFRVALTLLKVNEAFILRSYDFEQLLTFLKSSARFTLNRVQFIKECFHAEWLGDIPNELVEEMRAKYSVKLFTKLASAQEKTSLRAPRTCTTASAAAASDTAPAPVSSPPVTSKSSPSIVLTSASKPPRPSSVVSPGQGELLREIDAFSLRYTPHTARKHRRPVAASVGSGKHLQSSSNVSPSWPFRESGLSESINDSLDPRYARRAMSLFSYIDQMTPSEQSSHEIPVTMALVDDDFIHVHTEGGVDDDDDDDSGTSTDDAGGDGTHTPVKQALMANMVSPDTQRLLESIDRFVQEDLTPYTTSDNTAGALSNSWCVLKDDNDNDDEKQSS